MAAANTLGIDVGGTTTVVALLDAHNHVRGEASFPTRPEAGFEDCIGRIGRAAAELPGDFGAAGAAVAAYVDSRTGTLAGSPNLRWENVPFGPRLAEELGVPVAVENDVNAAAYGEFRADPAARQPLLAVFVGTGVGGGLITGGDIYRGADGFGVELGHVPVVAEGGESCGCGRRGCVEAYAGGSAIVRRAAERAGDGAFDDVDAVARAAEAGDDACRVVLDEAAEYMGMALAAAVNLLNPGTLVMGGGVTRAWPPLMERAAARMRESALPSSVAALVVRPALLGGRAGVIGAAALARDTLAGGRADNTCDA
jgi:glucokinase